MSTIEESTPGTSAGEAEAGPRTGGSERSEETEPERSAEAGTEEGPEEGEVSARSTVDGFTAEEITADPEAFRRHVRERLARNGGVVEVTLTGADGTVTTERLEGGRLTGATESPAWTPGTIRALADARWETFPGRLRLDDKDAADLTGAYRSPSGAFTSFKSTSPGGFREEARRRFYAGLNGSLPNEETADLRSGPSFRPLRRALLALVTWPYAGPPRPEIVLEAPAGGGSRWEIPALNVWESPGTRGGPCSAWEFRRHVHGISCGAAHDDMTPCGHEEDLEFRPLSVTRAENSSLTPSRAEVRGAWQAFTLLDGEGFLRPLLGWDPLALAYPGALREAFGRPGIPFRPLPLAAPDANYSRAARAKLNAWAQAGGLWENWRLTLTSPGVLTRYVLRAAETQLAPGYPEGTLVVEAAGSASPPLWLSPGGPEARKYAGARWRPVIGGTGVPWSAYEETLPSETVRARDEYRRRLDADSREERLRFLMTAPLSRDAVDSVFPEGLPSSVPVTTSFVNGRQVGGQEIKFATFLPTGKPFLPVGVRDDKEAGPARPRTPTEVFASRPGPREPVRLLSGIEYKESSGDGWYSLRPGGLPPGRPPTYFTVTPPDTQPARFSSSGEALDNYRELLQEQALDRLRPFCAEVSLRWVDSGGGDRTASVQDFEMGAERVARYQVLHSGAAEKRLRDSFSELAEILDGEAKRLPDAVSKIREAMEPGGERVRHIAIKQEAARKCEYAAERIRAVLKEEGTYDPGSRDAALQDLAEQLDGEAEKLHDDMAAHGPPVDDRDAWTSDATGRAEAKEDAAERIRAVLEGKPDTLHDAALASRRHETR